MVKGKKIYESLAPGMVNRGDFTRGIPFYGTKGDFNFTLGRSQFTPGISIKQTSLTDMSRPGDPGFSPMDNMLSRVKRFFKPGDRVRGVKVNSMLRDGESKTVVGKVIKIEPNYSNDSIRVFIKDPKTLKVHEIYVESMEKIYESRGLALDFNNFIETLYD
jgi:hypothetical protein